jgi:hypothetical protein
VAGKLRRDDTVSPAFVHWNIVHLQLGSESQMLPPVQLFLVHLCVLNSAPVGITGHCISGPDNRAHS